MTDLTFQFPSNPSTSVDLTFGATGGPAPGDVLDATLVAKFTMRASAVVGYDLGVWRGLVSDFAIPHQQAAKREAVVAGAWQPSVGGDQVTRLPFGEPVQIASSTTSGWHPAQALQHDNDEVWGVGIAAGQTRTLGWSQSPAAGVSAVAPWQRAQIVGANSVARFGLAKNTPREAVVPWQNGAMRERAVVSPAGVAALPVNLQVIAPWQRAQIVASTGGPRYLPPPPAVDPVRPDTVIDLRYCKVWSLTDLTTLVFGLNPCGGVIPDSPVYILPARFYMSVHSITATTFPGMVPISITDVSLAADVDSTAWTFTAKGPVSLFDTLAPTAGAPAQIAVTIDGMLWVFLVDRLQLEERFGSRSATIAGRSATALVGQPYSRETARLTTTARNAQQIAAESLALSGVGLDWGITDWLVPAGAWSHTGTPLAAVQAVAQAAGGFVNSHRSDPTLLVRHPYPTLPGGIPGGPWNWGGAFAADVEIAPDAVVSKSIERLDGPDIDGVYVSGTNQGVLAHVYRQGTLGAKLAQMEVDPLITANAAAQQRGYSVIGRAGAKHMVQITLPVLTGGANPGVLDVGQLVQINESVPWRGMVRSVSVQAGKQSVRQSISLERHLA